MREHLKNYIDTSMTPEVRGLRILLEYFYATEIFKEIKRDKIKVISVFGSARTTPHSVEYRLASKLGSLLYQSGFAVVTGASRGIMEAANQGVADEIARELSKGRKAASLEQIRKSADYKRLLRRHSVGLSISLPMESENNPFVGVGATFHYFAVRKFFFGTLSSGFIACEGGWGTRDELFEILTLVQTGKAPVMPIIYLSPDPSHLKQDLAHTLRKAYISKDDLSLLQFAKTPIQAMNMIRNFYHRVEKIDYDREGSVTVTLKKPISEKQKKKVEEILVQGCRKHLELEWRGKELLLPFYTPSSYGFLKRAIEEINRDSNSTK